MSNKKNYFGEGIVFTISDYFIYFLMGSIYFWGLNIPLIIYLIISSINPSFNSKLFLFIALIPIFPAGSALLSVMGKLFREKSVNITRDFFCSYKTNFSISAKIGLLQVSLLAIFHLEKFYISLNEGLLFFKYLIEIFILICIMINFYLISIISRFYVRFFDLYKLSIYYLIRKPHIGIVLMIMIYLLGIVAYKLSFILALFFTSILGYVVMSMMNNILTILEGRIK